MTSPRILILTLAFTALAHAGTAFAAEDIVRTNGAVATVAGTEYGRLVSTNGSIRLADGVTAGRASTTNGSITAGDDVGSGRMDTVNGSIRIGERVRVEDSVETVNGSILVRRGGEIGGDVKTVNGDIGLVATTVGGSVSLANGDLTVGIGSRVRGGVHVHKPSTNWMPIRISTRQQRVIIGPGAVVEGPMEFERDVLLYVHDSARIGEVTGAEPVRYSTPTAPRPGGD